MLDVASDLDVKYACVTLVSTPKKDLVFDTIPFSNHDSSFALKYGMTINPSNIPDKQQQQTVCVTIRLKDTRSLNNALIL
jgi:hypothetical protein